MFIYWEKIQTNLQFTFIGHCRPEILQQMQSINSSWIRTGEFIDYICWRISGRQQLIAPQHKTPCPQGHDNSYFGIPFLCHHYYILSCCNTCTWLGIDKKTNSWNNEPRPLLKFFYFTSKGPITNAQYWHHHSCTLKHCWSVGYVHM